MKTAKLIIGIISIVLFGVIIFQSCAAGLSNAIEENGETSGTNGFVLAVCMLIAGIIGIAARKSKAGGIVAGIFFIFGAIIGITGYGSYSDLLVWAIICFIFGAVFILGSILGEKKVKSTKEKDVENDE